MPEVEILSHDEIVRRRNELLSEAAMSEEELRNRAAAYTLSPREAGILSELEGLEFLLGA